MVYAVAMSRVVIDCRFAGLHGGLGTYTREVVSALLRRNDACEYRLLLLPDDPLWFPARSGVDVLRTTAAHYSLAEQFLLPSLLRRAGATAYYAPQFNVPLYCPVPFVVTVHDLILHRFPNAASLPRRLAYRLLLKHAITAASGILAVSQATKDDILLHYGARYANRVKVAHPGIATMFAPADASAVADARMRHGITGQYLLYVGNAKQHKNVQMLLDAFGAAALPAYTLVVVSAGPEVARLRLPSGVRVLSHVPQADLPALYTGASACVSATLAEGFGLPMLEAMACGCPVLATDVPAVREACGQWAHLVPPTADALAAGMRSVIARVHGQRSAQAREHAAQFSWDTTAAQVATMLAEFAS